jgi:hypothetical protein
MYPYHRLNNPLHVDGADPESETYCRSVRIRTRLALAQFEAIARILILPHYFLV